ncbi:alpha/beta-Hydrolases superfamily protein [Striga hermonthica]|uniref:Alpha/beta-Hydrolases superfamily protein n=1 Tax=Striga hermonthica TaxID=68872 RepID=A0A9N7N7H5_STRHE|nr:alpha/beta-Hydrolases superfamily protein [Striga hermonthica]
MLLKTFSSISRTLQCTTTFSFRSFLPARRLKSQMGVESLSLIRKSKRASFRLIDVFGFKTDLMEIPSQDTKFHVLFIPGNPGVISFYTDFLESLYELLGGSASVTGKYTHIYITIGHISHSEKDWGSGRLFSLQEQISHKISFIEQELGDVEVPIVLVGHSIGSYISLEILRRCHEKVIYCIGLYPFLALNDKSSAQSSIKKIAALPTICTVLSFMGGLLGRLPSHISRFLVKISMGKSWSSSSIDVLCTHVLQYHTIRNMLYMAMTEFQELPKTPDLDFIREKKTEIALLFGHDDHWGPLHLYQEICTKVPDVSIEVEREGHTHAFSCTEAGSLWAAQHVSSLIKSNIETRKNI